MDESLELLNRHLLKPVERQIPFPSFLEWPEASYLAAALKFTMKKKHNQWMIITYLNLTYSAKDQ